MCECRGDPCGTTFTSDVSGTGDFSSWSEMCGLDQRSPHSADELRTLDEAIGYVIDHSRASLCRAFSAICIADCRVERLRSSGEHSPRRAGGGLITTQDDVNAVNDEYARAMADQDVARMISLYADDARLFFSDTPVVQGHEAIAAAYTEVFKDGPVAITFDSVDVFGGGVLVVDIGYYASSNERGKYVVVFRRQLDGTLKIAVEADITDGSRSLG
jgi:uncharacterized protein (TIGR02246 family)